MDLEAEVLAEHSRRQADRIAAWVGTDRRRFDRLMEIFLHGAYRSAQLSSMPVGLCLDRHPALLTPYLGRMIARMDEPGVHVAVRRCVVRALQCAEIPPRWQGKVATLCFNYLADMATPVAVRCLAMTVLARIARARPALGRELKLVIAGQLPYGSAAFRSRAARVMRELDGHGAGAPAGALLT